MAITPEIYNEVLLDPEYEISIYPSKTYFMNLEKYRIIGNVDDIESLPQAIFCIIYTERGKFPAYSDNYGIELESLFGMPISYVIPEVERRITEALTWDTRIEDVDSFEFDVKKGVLTVNFVVHSIYGDVSAERTVNF